MVRQVVVKLYWQKLLPTQRMLVLLICKYLRCAINGMVSHRNLLMQFSLWYVL